jgi:integrase
MAIEKLSATKIGRLMKPGRHGDGGGLYLQISKTGVKSWIFRYEINGSEHFMGLGPLRAVDIRQAREGARVARACLARKADPLQERARVATEKKKTKLNGCRKAFNECAVEYIEHHKNGWKSVKHRKQWESSLKAYALPIGKMFVDEIDTAHVLRVLQPIWLTKTETASRIQKRIERVLSWATACKYRAGDNPARWDGHLQEILLKPSRIKAVRHHPSLPYQEIREFFRCLNAQEGIGARALEFLILTTCRTSEALHARWQEIDFTRRTWTIPPERMKNGRQHRIPLSDGALKILRALQGHPDWVFPNMKQDNPAYGSVMLDMLGKMGRTDITVHGFRSTFRVWAAEQTGYAQEIVKMALSHKQASAVERAYQRSDLFERRRGLMRDWADWCI